MVSNSSSQEGVSLSKERSLLFSGISEGRNWKNGRTPQSLVRGGMIYDPPQLTCENSSNSYRHYHKQATCRRWSHLDHR